MAGIPWGKYDRADWERIPKGQPGYSSTARTYRLKQNHKIQTSRRQFDKHYGSAVQYGTYERKAKSQAGPKQLLKPARGRTSALKLTPAEQEVEIGRRRVAKQETAQQRKVTALRSKSNRLPQTITLRNFAKGKQIRKFRTGVNRDEIENIRIAAEKSRLVFGYWVGLELISERDSQIKTPTLFSQRDIKMSFSESDFREALAKAQQLSYATLTGMWIALHLTRAAAIKHGARKP